MSASSRPWSGSAKSSLVTCRRRSARSSRATRASGSATLGRVGYEGRYDYAAIGNVTILASRLSAKAEAGQILVSQRLNAAVEDRIETAGIGELELKGMSRPVPAFSVTRAKA